MLYVSVASSPSLNELHTDPLFFSLFSGVGSGMGALLQHQQHVESSSAKAAPDRSFAVLFGVMMSCSTGGVTASSNVQFNTDIWLVKISSIVCRLSHVSLSCSSRSVAGFFPCQRRANLRAPQTQACSSAGRSGSGCTHPSVFPCTVARGTFHLTPYPQGFVATPVSPSFRSHSAAPRPSACGILPAEQAHSAQPVSCAMSQGRTGPRRPSAARYIRSAYHPAYIFSTPPTSLTRHSRRFEGPARTGCRPAFGWAVACAGEKQAT